MGPVQHRQLINLLSLCVALNLVAGVGALYVRGGSASATAENARSSRSAGGDTSSGGILAGGQFRNRRGDDGKTGSSGASGSPSSTTPTTRSPASSTTDRPTTSSSGKPATSSTAPPSSNTSPSTAPSTTTQRGGTAGAPTPGQGSSSSTGPTPSDNGTVVVDDAAGDTTVDGTTEFKAEGRADIVRSQAANRAGLVALSVQVRQSVDPKKDSRWGSESTFLAWEIDTNGDGAGEYEVQYFLADGNYGGAVSRPGESTDEALCDATANYAPDTGYTVVFESSCLGDPASFSYRAGVYYDSDPKDPNADVIFDATPNGGFSFPVARRP